MGGQANAGCEQVVDQVLTGSTLISKFCLDDLLSCLELHKSNSEIKQHQQALLFG